LRFDYDYLFGIVKSILIHPIDASAEKVKYDRKNSGIFHCENSTVERILGYNQLAAALSKKTLPLSTRPSDRAVLSCDHHALLFTSLVRYLGIPIRVRTGYSKYIVEGYHIPHWVTEVLEPNHKNWSIVDPERQCKSVERNQFVFAAQAWKEHMETGKAFPRYSGFVGRQGLKYALLCDLNCIFKNELLSYEWRLKAHKRNKPSIVRTSYERLSEDDRMLIDSISVLMLNPDDHLDELWQLYTQIVEDQDIENSGYKKIRSL
jgi:hypothetical protein